MTRKSCRIRTPSLKAQEVQKDSTNKAVTHTEPVSRKRKSEPVNELHFSENVPAKKSKSMTNLALEDDKIDPVEKLLCLTNFNNDILFDLDADDSASEPASPRSLTASSSSSVSSDASASFEYEDSPSYSPYPNMELDFSKVINDNLRSYYLSACKSPMEIHNDNSSFSILNKKTQQNANGETGLLLATPMSREVPFFKNVNFNPVPKFGNSIDDYLHYDDDESNTEEKVPETSFMPHLPNLSFHYRRDDKLNLSLSDHKVGAEPQDVWKILNKSSILSGKTSEMVGTSRLLINDFLL